MSTSPSVRAGGELGVHLDHLLHGVKVGADVLLGELDRIFAKMVRLAHVYGYRFFYALLVG